MLSAGLRVALANVRVRPLRSLLIVAMVSLGVGILGGSIVYGDTAKAAFFDDLARGAIGVDVQATAGDDPKLAGAAALAALAAVPGVAHVDARPDARIAMLGQHGRAIMNEGEIGLAVPVPSWSGFASFRIIAGRLPSTVGEASLDRSTAAREGKGIGTRVSVLDRSDTAHELTVVGLVDFGATKQYADRSVVILTPDDLTSLATVAGGPRLVAAARGGVSQAALRARVADALGPGYAVTTGDELRANLAAEAAKYVRSFLTTLRVTSLVALAVALLVVYNTFQIVTAQRTREHALLRCVGASRRQVVRTVVVEAALIGSVAGVGSAFVGIAMGHALAIGQGLFGHRLPDYHVVVSAQALVVPLATGFLATIASAVLPAVAAGRVSPIAALATSTDREPGTGRSVVRRRITLAAAVVLAATGFAVLEHGRGRGSDGLTAMVGGAMLVFLAVVLTLPMVITSLTAPLRWLLGRVFGATGRLAMHNARRHPIRSAATATAVLAGIAPMTAFAILLTSAQAQGARELAENFPVDFVVSYPPGLDTAGGDRLFPAALVERMRGAAEFGVVAEAKLADGQIDGRGAQVATTEPGVLGSRLAAEVRAGSLGDLGPGTAAITTQFADQYHLAVGDVIRVGPPDRGLTARIVATYDGWPVPADLLVNWSDFGRVVEYARHYLLIGRADTTSAAAAAAAVDRNLVDEPLAVLSSTADRRESLADAFGKRLVQFNVLLGASMLIAVLGMANALYLSVLERTRESAILRAAGLGRRQMYGMLLVEAVLTALIGAAVGVAFGVGLGWLTARDLVNFYGHGAPVIPVTTILAYVGIAALGGAVASILPARRAARASIVAAIESP